MNVFVTGGFGQDPTFEARPARDMIPRILTEWTRDRLIGLLDKGIFEPESFDFKEFRTTKKTDPEKQDIRKDCCAFANGFGGFLVYGVSDDRSLPGRERLIGIDKDFEFPKEFGNFPKECKPSILWDFLNPPIDLENGKVVHVVFIPQSWRGPHCIQAEKPQEGFVFPKRTNKGNEFMNYEEVRFAFLGYYEKRLKLQLLLAELQNIISDAQTMIVPEGQTETHVPTNSFNLTVIETVLIDTYTITHQWPDLLQSLMRLRNAARSVNNTLQMFNAVFHMPITNKNQMIREHNQHLRQRCPHLIEDANRALGILQRVLST